MPNAAPDNPYAPPVAETESQPRVHSTFCGLRPRWTKPDRFYKFYITDTALYGAWLGGQFHDKLSVRNQLSPFYLTVIGIPIVELVARWIDKRRQRLQLQYDSLSDYPKDFIRKDPRNLVVTRDMVQAITISTKKSHWTFWQNSGIINITCDHQPSVRILVRDSRGVDAIARDLMSAKYPVKHLASQKLHNK